jgi:hypothetical protein
MNSYKNTLNQIRVVLGMTVKLASEELVDGTVVEAEVFEEGYPLFVKTEEGNSPAPEGTHETKSGLIVTVDAEGKIVSVEEKAAEALQDEEVKEEITVEAEEEVSVEVETEGESEEVEDKVKEILEKIVMSVEEIAAEVADVKEKVQMMEQKYAKLAKEPAAKKYPTITNESFSSEEGSDKLEARVAALQKLKAEKFFKK